MKSVQLPKPFLSCVCMCKFYTCEIKLMKISRKKVLHGSIFFKHENYVY